jgi:hypothetical protein
MKIPSKSPILKHFIHQTDKITIAALPAALPHEPN